MKEFGNPIPLTRGLTPFSRTPLNAPFLEDMTGLIPRPLLAEGPPALSYPVTWLPTKAGVWAKGTSYSCGTEPFSFAVLM
mgnify:CR=1 FL=1